MATLVTYFSAEGRTAEVAKEFAERIKADVFEILPEKVYTKADINYMNPLSRCNREQIAGKDVPVVGTIENFDQYDVVQVLLLYNDRRQDHHPPDFLHFHENQ